MLKKAAKTSSSPRRGGSRAKSKSAPGRQPAAPADAFIVDDEEGICKLIGLALQPLGLKTRSFHTAPEAVEALEHSLPDVVFLDIALKGSDAIDVIRALGAMHYGGVVQLMSGRSMPLLEDVRRVGARHGLNMRPPLEKPFRIEDLHRAVMSEPFEGQTETTLSLAPTNRLDRREALEKGWLELWYQPKIHLRSKVLAGVEGLIRCRHPVHGLLDPASVPTDDDAATDAALLEHMVVTALRDWDEMSQVGLPLRTAINTSISALNDVELAPLVRENRPKSDKWPGLVLELTEEEVVRDLDLVHEISTQLSIWGISLAIADFGEGFTSFARLRELPFVELKLDSAFVGGSADDPMNAGICRAIVDLAHHFGVVSVADGLDSVADLNVIRSMGCDLGQGPILCAPMTKTDLLAKLLERSRSHEPWFR